MKDEAIKQILLYVNTGKIKARREAIKIEDFLLARKIKVYSFTELKQTDDPPDIDLVITLGGDGTVLHYVHSWIFKSSIPIFAIHLGTFGYITECAVSNWEQLLSALLNGKSSKSIRFLMDVEHRIRTSNKVYKCKSLNEIVLANKGIAHITRINIRLGHDDFQVAGDGLIVATPTGSTAYSVAAGGPIVHPEILNFVLTPICPFSLSTRTMILPSTERIKLTLDKKDRSKGRDASILTIDGQIPIDFTNSSELTLYYCGDSVEFITAPDYSPYTSIKNKLRWQGTNA